MCVKAIGDLAQLPDADLFAEVEQGASLCVANTKRIAEDYLFLANEKRPRGAEILRLASEEEASKVLILIDAIRCPRAESCNDFARQLKYFNDHLAKGIYAEYCGLNPVTFGEVKRWVDLERKKFYLDGPNDVDWIFYNDILRRREETIYVDYVESDGKHWWHDPTQLEELRVRFVMSARNPVLRLMNALNDAGCLASPALKVIAEIWRPVALDEDFSWDAARELNVITLEAMKKQGVLKDQDQAQEACSVIANEWLFPLYPLDLRKENVDKKELAEVRKRWHPEW